MELYELEQKLTQALMDLPDNQAKPFQIRASKAGDCPRLMTYQILDGPSPLQPGQVWRMYIGTWIHKMMGELMSLALGDDFVNAEEELIFSVIDSKGHPHMGTGHSDGEISSMDAIYELKSVSDSTYKMIINQDHPLPQHYEQGNLYAYVKKRKWIVFHYVNKNDGSFKFFVVPSSIKIAEETVAKFRGAIESAAEGKLIARPYTDPTCSPCWYCEKKDKCYEGFEAEFKKMGGVTLRGEDEPEILVFIRRTLMNKRRRLASEKMEDELKEKIGRFMLSRGYKSMTVGDYQVDAKLGKKNNTLINIERLDTEESNPKGTT